MRLSSLIALAAFTILAPASPIIQKRARGTYQAPDENFPNGLLRGPGDVLSTGEHNPTTGVTSVYMWHPSNPNQLISHTDDPTGKTKYEIYDGHTGQMTSGTVNHDGTSYSFHDHRNGFTTPVDGPPLQLGLNHVQTNLNKVNEAHKNAIASQSENTGGGRRTGNAANEKSHRRR